MSHDLETLTLELIAMQTSRGMKRDHGFAMRKAKDGRDIFIVMCPNGYHESYESHAHAMHLLVDSFRTRVEDLPATHERIQAWGGAYADLKAARSYADSIAKGLVAKFPDMPGEERDALLLQSLADSERHNVKAHATTHPTKPPKKHKTP